MKANDTVSEGPAVLVIFSGVCRLLNSCSAAVPPYTTYKGQRKWRPRSLVQSSVIQEEDNKDESASGNLGHGKNQASPTFLIKTWGKY